MNKKKGEPFLAYYPMCLPHFPKMSGDYVEPKGKNGRYQNYRETPLLLDPNYPLQARILQYGLNNAIKTNYKSSFKGFLRVSLNRSNQKTNRRYIRLHSWSYLRLRRWVARCRFLNISLLLLNKRKMYSDTGRWPLVINKVTFHNFMNIRQK